MKVYAGYDNNIKSISNFKDDLRYIITAIRKNKNLTQQQLGNLCNMHAQAINRMEHQSVSLKHLCRIVKATELKLLVVVGDLGMPTWRYSHTKED